MVNSAFVGILMAFGIRFSTKSAAAFIPGRILASGLSNFENARKLRVGGHSLKLCSVSGVMLEIAPEIVAGAGEKSERESFAAAADLPISLHRQRSKHFG